MPKNLEPLSDEVEQFRLSPRAGMQYSSKYERRDARR